VSRTAELTVPADVPLEVVVGIVSDDAGRVLIGQRPAGKPMAGAWEFPGGKLEPDETALSGLKRELAEELGIEVQAAEPLLALEHRYPELSVHLDVWWVSSWSGPVVPHDGQALRWVEPERLEHAKLLPADGPIVAAVRARLACS